MIYYLCLLLCVLLLWLLSRLIPNKRYSDAAFLLLSCLAVILFQGFRAPEVGIDVPGYLDGFLKIGRMNEFKLSFRNYEPGYVLLNRLIYNMGLRERGLLICVSAFINLPIFYTIYKCSEDKLMSVLWYFSFGQFVFTFTGLRQCMSMAICFAAYPFLRDKKPIRFYLCVFFASFFHSSSLICLFMYPAFHIKLKRRWLIPALCALGALIIIRTDLIDMALPYMGSYGSSKYYCSTGAYTMFAAYLLLLLISFYVKDGGAEFQGFRCLLFILVMIYSFAPVHMLLPRYGFVFELYMSLFIPVLVRKLRLRPEPLVRFGCCALLSLCMLILMGQFDTLPFSFDFNL